jgi:hypothetical protein
MINGKTSEAFSGVSLPPISDIHPDNIRQITLINQLAYANPVKLAEEQIKSYIR